MPTGQDLSKLAVSQSVSMHSLSIIVSSHYSFPKTITGVNLVFDMPGYAVEESMGTLTVCIEAQGTILNPFQATLVFEGVTASGIQCMNIWHLHT